jgi:hypothetical protein
MPRRTGRARGGQPGNRNALKHGRYSRVSRQIRQLEEILYRYEDLGGDRRALRRYRPIVDRLRREEADLRNAVLERMAARTAGIPRWMREELASSGHKSGNQEIE